MLTQYKIADILNNNSKIHFSDQSLSSLPLLSFYSSKLIGLKMYLYIFSGVEFYGIKTVFVHTTFVQK